MPNQIALAQAVAEHQLKKIFTFHRNVASARSFTSAGSEGIGTHLPDFAALHVNGAMSTAARDGLMTEFKAARQAVMSNARCLTEGIDVPTVDMVPFLTIVGRRRRAGRVRRSLGRVAGGRSGRTGGVSPLVEAKAITTTNQHRNQEPNGSRSPPTRTLDKLRRAIATRCLDRLARPWDEMLRRFGSVLTSRFRVCG